MRFMIACATCFASAAGAQDLPSLDAAIAALAGQEIQATGTIAYTGRAAAPYYFHTGGTTYNVKPALSREMLAEIEACPPDAADGPCTATVNAEVQVESGRVVLIVYDIASITRG